MTNIPRWTVACALTMSLASCTSEQPVTVTPTVDAEALRAEATPQSADLVDLTVYYRHGRGQNAFLTPVVRDVPVADAQPRRVMELLLKGPNRRDPRRLQPALPTTTRLRGFSVHRGTATVTLSHHAVSDAKTLGKRPVHEALALAAVANTLTEFPVVRRVRLFVEGPSKRRFWGYWGLPQVLVRDESVVEPQNDIEWPRVAWFSGRRQRVGVVRERRPAPAIQAVRLQALATFTRLTVEITAPNGSDLTGPVPTTEAVRDRRGRLRLRVRGQPGEGVIGNIMKQFHDPALKGARVDVLRRPRRVVVTLRPRRRTGFWLHTLPEPARVVLDIRR